MTEFKARPTVYKGIKMRSRLEAGFAKWLDERSFDWEYEPCAFGSDKGQYLPDFKINGLRCSWLTEPTDAYVEVKPASFPNWDDESALDQFEALMRGMALIWESEPDAVLLLAQPEGPVAVGQDGFTCTSVGQLDTGLNPGSSDPFPWPRGAVWAIGPDGTTSLARLLHGSFGPWPDGYWKPTPQATATEDPF
jgi:hypothetical protein